MRVHVIKHRPRSWTDYAGQIRHRAMLPFFALEWVLDWIAYGLSNWRFLEVLEYAGSLSVLVAVVFYYAESGDRLKQKHYQAWQVINTAQGKGGSGGRIEALQELNADRVPLVGVDASGSFLQGVRLHGANLLRGDLSASDLRMSDLSAANLQFADLTSANFRQSNLRGAIFSGADLENADLAGADLSQADLSGAKFDNADLCNVVLRGIKYDQVASIKGANIYGIREAPSGFAQWALSHGAVAVKEEE
jgi:hypothetical protein